MNSLKFFILIIVLSTTNLVGTVSAEHENLPVIKIAIFQAPPALIPQADGNHQGMLVDFLKEVASREHWNIQWVHREWPEIIALAKNQQIDIIPFIAYSKERAQFLDYNNKSFITGWGQVYSHEDTQSNESIFDFPDKKIALVKDEIYAIRFKQMCQQFDVTCNTIEVVDYQKAFELLHEKQVDRAVSGNLVGYNFESKYNVKPTSLVFSPSKVLFASPTNIGQKELNAIDKYLTQWRQSQNSPYFKIRDKWLGDTSSKTTLPSWLIYTLIGSIGLLLFSAIIVLFLRRQINRKTADLADQSEQIRQIINLVPHMIYATDSNGKLILANDYAMSHFGLKNKDFKNITTNKLKRRQPQSSNLFDDEHYLLSKDASPVQKEIKTADHRHKEIILRTSKVPFVSRSNQLPSVVTVGVDVTEEKVYEEQIKYMANHDALTKLPNRLLLKDRINQSLALSLKNQHNGAVLFLDLDYFKTINDSLGHHIGDKLLIEVADRIKAKVDLSDTIARLGGDEFIVQLNELPADLEEAEKYVCKFASKLNRQIARDYLIDGHNIFISASIGIVIYPRDATSHEQIMQHADTAMYQAKSTGRNRYTVFKKEMGKAVVRRHQIETELRNAVANQEFIIEYQPQLTGTNASLIGLEALVRWQHPEQGLIYPAEFIHVAEDSNLIIELGKWVMQNSFQQIASWLEKYSYSPCVTINLSVAQIRQPGLVETVNNLLETTNIPSSLIEFEVTESLLLSEVSSSLTILNELKKLGVKISIDDFGTGFSSLNYLKKLPLDKLKIDRSFIADIPGDPDNEIIVKTIIGMSRDLGLEVIAEGVENKLQLDFLISENCHTFQGFYFDASLSVAEIENKYLNKASLSLLSHSTKFQHKPS